MIYTSSFSLPFPLLLPLPSLPLPSLLITSLPIPSLIVTSLPIPSSIILTLLHALPSLAIACPLSLFFLPSSVLLLFPFLHSLILILLHAMPSLALPTPYASPSSEGSVVFFMLHLTHYMGGLDWVGSPDWSGGRQASLNA